MTPGKKLRGKRGPSAPAGVFTLGPGGPLTPGYWINVTGGVQRKFQKVKTYFTENWGERGGHRVVVRLVTFGVEGDAGGRRAEGEGCAAAPGARWTTVGRGGRGSGC